MTREEQKEFVQDLSRRIVKEIIDTLPRIPQEWGGIELRQYIADRFATIVWRKMDRKERKAYDNVILINNL